MEMVKKKFTLGTKEWASSNVNLISRGSNICIIHSVEPILQHITHRTKDLLEHFGQLMDHKGVKLKDLNETIYYATHLALTFIQIKELKKELKEFTNNLNLNDKGKEK